MRIVTVGRGTQNNVVISDPMVSVRHLELRKYDNGQYSVQDCQSTNGTFVNGQRIKGEVLLRRVDKVRIGQTNLPWLQYFGDDDGGMRTWMIVLIAVGGVLSLAMVLLLTFAVLKNTHNRRTTLNTPITQNTSNTSNMPNTQNTYNTYNTYNTFNTSQTLPVNNQNEVSIEVPQPRDIVVAPGQTLEETFAAYYPSQPQDKNRNIGGAKFLAEQAADKQGKTFSRNYNQQSVSIHVCPLHEMYVVPDCAPESPVTLARNGEIEISSINVHDLHCVTMTLRNLTQSRVEVLIYQGMILEIIDEGEQNLVIAKDEQIVLEANETRSVSLVTYCASPHRGLPSGRARVVPYRMYAPSTIYQDQSSVWRYVEQNVNHRVVFYAGANATCVRIPSIGYVSYSYLPVDGTHILYQVQMNHSATDSCVIYLNDYQYGCLKRKVESLRENSTSFFGNYNVTSFVMEVAEAGGIYYGSRTSISSAQQFVSEMQTYSAHR